MTEVIPFKCAICKIGLGYILSELTNTRDILVRLELPTFCESCIKLKCPEIRELT